MDQDTPLLPVKNKYSILSYYFGFSAVLPLIGLITSVLAVVFGFKAINFNKHTPVPGAKVHAVIGIALGSFLALVHYGLLLVLLIAIFTGSIE